LQRFESYDWPGNVRELQNAVAKRLALGDLADMSKPAVAPRAVTPTTDAAPQLPTVAVPVEVPFSMARQRVIADFERAYVAYVLEKHGGNVLQAARASGIARRYFNILKARIT
jgi:DNA-binding NtrC family response regulator